MRLFTAIEVPPDVLLRLERLVAVLRPEALIKWSPLDNLHVTTKFIGEWPESRMEELHQALLAVPPRDPFGVDVSGLGWFPNERSPRVLWAGVNGGLPLSTLVQEIEERLLGLGVARESREYSAHLTLARIKSPVPLRSLREKLQELLPAQIGTFQVSQFSLFRSDPGSNASIYRKLRDYRFEATLAAASSAQP